MKKYITIATLLAAGTAFANAEEAIIVSNPWMDGDSKKATIHGFQINFASLSFKGTGTATESDYTLPSGQYEISNLFVAYDSYNNYTENKLVILDSEFNLVTLSSSSSITTDYYASYSRKGGSSYTFEAGTFIADSTKTYYAFAVSTSTTMEALPEIGSTLSTANYSSIASTLRAIGSTYDNRSGVTANKATSTASFGSITPCVQYTLTAVPEPSAFGLLAGLGALAFVASRRRRK